jgi:hypothetical protein
MPYADQRAERFLTEEARKLPTDAPGLIMVEMGRAPGGFRTWEPIFRRRLQPTMHTRVGGIGMFGSGLLPTPEGEAALYETKFISNPYAKIPLPSWIAEVLQTVGRAFEARVHPPVMNAYPSSPEFTAP